MEKREKGILTVEASIVLTLMTLFILFLFSFIRIYRAENVVSHATLQAADAIALESYLRENALDEKADDVVYLANRLTGAASLDAASFESLRSAGLPTLAKSKFITAVADTEINADRLLAEYGVKDGLEGIDFSSSTVDLDHDDIIINVSYTLKIQFPIFGATEIDVTKSAKAKTFGEILFEITAEPENSEMGSTSGSGNYQHGTTIQLNAKPNYGYKFKAWDDGNTDDTRVVPVTEAQKYVAYFEPDSFGVNTAVSPEGTGTVTGEGSYTYLSTAELKASAKPGYHFEKWSVYKHKDSTTAFVTNSNVSQTVDQSYTYTANFAPNTYTIRVVASGANGTVTVKSGSNFGTSVSVTYGSTFDLLQTAPTGYVFKGWKMDGGSSNISSTEGIVVPATYPNGETIPNNATITYTAYFDIAPSIRIEGGAIGSESTTFTAVTVPNNESVLWSSSNSNVATVNSSGKVTAVGDGKVVITATLNYHGQVCSDSVTVKIGIDKYKLEEYNYRKAPATSTNLVRHYYDTSILDAKRTYKYKGIQYVTTYGEFYRTKWVTKNEIDSAPKVQPGEKSKSDKKGDNNQTGYNMSGRTGYVFDVGTRSGYIFFDSGERTYKITSIR